VLSVEAPQKQFALFHQTIDGFCVLQRKVHVFVLLSAIKRMSLAGPRRRK
jgi:hypothetical protein